MADRRAAVLTLIPIHVAWRDERGVLDQLIAVEFSNDYEAFSLGTDPLDGEEVSVYSNFVILDPLAKTCGACRVDWGHHEPYVGNICWDIMWVVPAEAAKFAEFLRRCPHWTVEVGYDELRAKWDAEPFDGKAFIRELIAVCEMRADLPF